MRVARETEVNSAALAGGSRASGDIVTLASVLSMQGWTVPRLGAPRAIVTESLGPRVGRPSSLPYNPYPAWPPQPSPWPPPLAHSCHSCGPQSQAGKSRCRTAAGPRRSLHSGTGLRHTGPHLPSESVSVCGAGDGGGQGMAAAPYSPL